MMPNMDIMHQQANRTIEGLSPREVAALLGISKSTVLNLIRVGQIPYVRISPRRYIIERRELEAYLDRRRLSAEQAACAFVEAQTYS